VYFEYELKINECAKIFGTDASKLTYQTRDNAPRVDISKTSTQLGVIANAPNGAYGTTDYSAGPYGTILIAWDHFSGSDTSESIMGTFIHELGNLLDYQINGVTYDGKFMRHYGNPNDTWDTDTGYQFEQCVTAK
jgi:hypothetical protein